MKNSLSFFFIMLFLSALPITSVAANPVNTTQSHTHSYQKATTPHHTTHHDEWLDFDDEEEEEAFQKPKTRWQRFMGGVDKFALQMKALWAFKIKPWWKEKHGKEITIGTASALATLVITWIMYRRYKTVMRARTAINPDINPFAASKKEE